MAGTVLLCLFINTAFLEQYYISSKMDTLYGAYETISEVANSDSYGTMEFQEQIDDVCIKNNITLYIIYAYI